MKSKDILYLQCLKCGKFTQLYRCSSASVPEYSNLAAFITEHLRTCNPYYDGEYLSGFSGFRVLPWSECFDGRAYPEFTHIAICACGATATLPKRAGWVKDDDGLWVCGACQLFRVSPP